MALTDKLTAIGDAIREKSGTPELIPLAEMPGKIEVVYDVGYWNGHADGLNEGHEAGYEGGLADGYESGKQEEHDRFWDSFQQNGARTYYERAFVGYGFSQNNFYPKYNIVLSGNNSRLFYSWNTDAHTNFDLAERLEECGIVMNTSGATYLSNAFSYGRFSRIPTIDMSSCVNGSDSTTGIFNNNQSYLKTIEKVVVHDGITFSGWFTNTTGLENITIEGTIGNNFTISTCTNLTHDSLMSIINALKDYGTTATKTATLGTANLGRLSTEEKAIAAQKGWTLA